jgi:predicted transcriptional regulator of viral defense system
MPEQKLINEFIQNAGDIITSQQITEAGFHRSVLSQLVESNDLERIARGVYLKPSAWEDEMFLLQHRFSKGIFSHETALYLHGMTDRTPARFIMTFPWGYNATSLKDENIAVKRTVKDLYRLGLTELNSPAGNVIRAYDIERTLCDIVRGNNACDIQTVNQAMKHYAGSNAKDIQQLMEYAKKLRVKPKILTYMEILL